MYPWFETFLRDKYRESHELQDSRVKIGEDSTKKVEINGVHSIVGHKSLVIKNVTEADQGVYICSVTDHSSKNSKSEFILETHCKYKIIFYTCSREALRVNHNGSVVLVTKLSFEDFRWKRNTKNNCWNHSWICFTQETQPNQ